MRRILWLTGGIILLWALNIGRITFIFFAGKEWGESVAINVFHPFIGLVLFALGVIVMLLLIRPLGMEIPIGATSPPAAAPPNGAAPPLPSARPRQGKGAR